MSGSRSQQQFGLAAGFLVTVVFAVSFALLSRVEPKNLLVIGPPFLLVTVLLILGSQKRMVWVAMLAGILIALPIAIVLHAGEETFLTSYMLYFLLEGAALTGSVGVLLWRPWNFWRIVFGVLGVILTVLHFRFFIELVVRGFGL